MTLEQALRDAAERGELTHCSIVATAGPGKYGVVYHASYRGANEGVHATARDADPGEAIRKAIEAAPKTTPRAPRQRKPKDDPIDFG